MNHRSEQSVEGYYDALAPFYSLIYGDWDDTLARQGDQLQSLIFEHTGLAHCQVLDVACGIGTQVVALARIGHEVTGIDIAKKPLQRAASELNKRGLRATLVTGDMRKLDQVSGKQFDVVIAIDNPLAHMLTEEDLAASLHQMYERVRSGGLCIISTRDYDSEVREGVQLKPYGMRVRDGVTYVIFQTWAFRGELYDMTMYCIEDSGGTACTTHVMRSTLKAISPTRLMQAMERAGFVGVARHDDRFFQPILVGKRQ